MNSTLYSTITTIAKKTITFEIAITILIAVFNYSLRATTTSPYESSPILSFPLSFFLLSPTSARISLERLYSATAIKTAESVLYYLYYYSYYYQFDSTCISFLSSCHFPCFPSKHCKCIC